MLANMENKKFLLALCKEASVDPMDDCYKLYFVNNTVENIKSLKFTPDIEEKECEDFSSAEFFEEYTELKPKSIVELKSFDEMDLGIDITYGTVIRTEETMLEHKIDISKAIENSAYILETIPLLNKNGYIVYYS